MMSRFKLVFNGAVKKNGDTITVSPSRPVDLPSMDGGTTKMYRITIDSSSGRTLSQNDFLWWTYRLEAEMINNGHVGDGTVTPEDLYCQDIIHNTEGIPMIVVPEAVSELKNVFRAVKKIKTIYKHGKEYAVLQCWVGSSHWSKEQMAQWLEYRIRRLSEYGINIESYEEVQMYRKKLRKDRGDKK